MECRISSKLTSVLLDDVRLLLVSWTESIVHENTSHTPRDVRQSGKKSGNLPQFPTNPPVMTFKTASRVNLEWKKTANHLVSGSTLSFQRDVQQLPELSLQSYLDHLIDVFVFFMVPPSTFLPYPQLFSAQKKLTKKELLQISLRLGTIQLETNQHPARAP